ncbi:integrase core domain-containing protein [Leptospira sp. serovar Kenya]|uniref:integrase core domain-containing protein n=1 Tax=Leptospira TaxID=171 RepID=UPI001E62EF22|nr:MULTISPECIES: integrase core domain-containing protein [Leptospira]
MTEENHCYENPVAERINKTLKFEFGLHNTFNCFKEAQIALNQAASLYNSFRLGCISISVISLLILFIKLHNFCQLDFRSLQFLRKAVCFSIFVSCILNS